MSSPSLSPGDNTTPSAVSTGPTPLSATTASSSPVFQPVSFPPVPSGIPLGIGVCVGSLIITALFMIWALNSRAVGGPGLNSLLRRYLLASFRVLPFLRRYLPASFRWGRIWRNHRYQGRGGGGLWGGSRRGWWRRWVWQGQEREGASTPGEPGKAKPAMFNAWIERRRTSKDTLKWGAESVVSESVSSSSSPALLSCCAEACEPLCVALLRYAPQEDGDCSWGCT